MAAKNIIFFDDACRDHLLPFTFTRPVAALRVGILTISEKWQRSLNTEPSWYTQHYLRGKFPLKVQEVNWLINGSVLPDPRLVAMVVGLQPGEAIAEKDLLVAACVNRFEHAENILDTESILKKSKVMAPAAPPRSIRKLTDIFMMNGDAIRDDFKLITHKRRSATVYESNKVMNRADVFIEEGAVVEFTYLNATKGPIYIGKNAEVMEGAMIRGPFALGAHAEVKMGSKIYYPTSIGPYCKVGGEINSSVLFGYSNKAHEGYLGHSVIGEWCNLGADTNNSNLKNDYGDIRMWNYATKNFENTHLQFSGLMMGDHSKCSINTMFNTGTVVGVFANIFGTGFPDKFVPSFTWGGVGKNENYDFEKAMQVAQKVMERRGVQLTATDREILKHVYDLPVGWK